MWPYENDGRMYEFTSGEKVANPQYSKSGWAYACMDLRATSMASLPWKVTRNGEKLDKHPLIDLLTNFGPENNYGNAIKGTEIDLCMSGAGFWLRDVDVLKKLAPYSMKVIQTGGGITKFEQWKDGKKINTFKRNEIVYFREYNPDEDLGVGVAPIDVVKEDMDAEYQATLFISSHFANDAVPGLLLTTEQTVPELEMNRVLGWFNSKFGGVRNKGKIGMVDKGLKAQIVAANMQENAIVLIRDQARNDICVGFRVPKMLVGSLHDSTYTNAPETRKFFIEDLIIPRANALYADTINQDLVPYIDNTVKFEYAPEELQILQEDNSTKWERLQGGIESGVISPEFARAEMGWPEQAKPDEKALKQYEKKALNAVKRSEDPNVEFVTDEISVDRLITIRARLNEAKTSEDVKRAFR